MIRVENLVKRFGPTTALDRVSFTVPAGTVVGASAILQVKVVDRLPDVPPSRVFKSGGGAKC